MAYRLVNSELLRTKRVAVASATVIPTGALAGMTSGLAVDADNSTTEIAWCPAGSADGETTCELTTKDSIFILEETADANFAITDKNAEVDITAAQLIDLGSSSTDVLKVGSDENAGTVGSTTNVQVRINKPLNI